MRKFEHQIQNDGVNCGSFVCMFFDELLSVQKNQNRLNGSDPFIFRKKIYQEFIKAGEIEDNLGFCYICSKTEKDTHMMKSFNCWHVYHIDCFKKFYLKYFSIYIFIY